MVPLITLWLPILLAAIIVFVASAIMHTVLPYHKSDCQQIPDEALVLAALRTAGLKRGYYHFPFTSHKEMKSPAMIVGGSAGPLGTGRSASTSRSPRHRDTPGRDHGRFDWSRLWISLVAQHATQTTPERTGDQFHGAWLWLKHDLD